MVYNNNLDMYQTYYDTEVEYGYPGNQPLTQPTVFWFHGDTVSIEFDLTAMASPILPGGSIDASFLEHKKLLVDFYSFRMEHIKNYVFYYDKGDVTVTNDAIYVTLVIDNETSNDVFKRGTYYTKMTMDNDLVGAEPQIQTILPLDVYTFEVK